MNWMRLYGLGQAAAALALGLPILTGFGPRTDAAPAAPTTATPTAASGTNRLAELKALAEKGDAEAQNDLGNLLRRGDGVTADYTNAVRYYRLAAEQGLDKSEFHLGRAYMEGEGVGKDTKQAVVWLTKAAEKGYSKAQYHLAMLCARGDGTKKDLVQASKWLNLSAAQGEKSAIKVRNILESQMTPQQLDEARKLTAAFVPKSSAVKKSGKKDKDE